MSMKSTSFGPIMTWCWARIDPSARPYLTRCICVQDLVFDDEPQPLPLLLIALWPLQIPTHGGVCVCRHLKQVTNPSDEILRRYHRITACLDQFKTSFNLFEGCWYLLLLPGESKGRSVARGYSCWEGLFTWWTEMRNMQFLMQRKHREYKVCFLSYLCLGRHTNMRKCIWSRSQSWGEARLTFLLLKNKDTLITHSCELIL